MVIGKAELYKDKLRLYYTPELLMETLKRSGSKTNSVIPTVPQWELEGSEYHPDSARVPFGKQPMMEPHLN